MVEQHFSSILNQVALFTGLSEDALDLLSEHTSLRSFPKNALIINEGDKTDSLYIIKEGKVKVFLCDEEGKEVTLNFQGAGEYFGEMALLDEEPRSASIITLVPTKCYVLDKRDFIHCMEEYPDVEMRVMKHLSHRLRSLTDNVKNLALNDVYGRITSNLLKLAENEGGKLVIKQRLTQRDIANIVGASREMVTKIMKDLVDGGYITIKEKQIIINNKLPTAW